MTGRSTSIGRRDDLTPNPVPSGVAGVGSGTGLIAVAHTLGVNSTAGAVLTYLAPSLGFIVGSILYYFEVITRRTEERRIGANARKTLEEALKNEHTSEEHKARIRVKLEALEEYLVTTEVQRVYHFSQDFPAPETD